MTLTPKRIALFWLVALIALVGLVYIFRPILLPFVVGMAVAYFLDPVVDWLEARRLPRSLSAGLAIVMFCVLVAMVFLLFVPLLHNQGAELATRAPHAIAKFRGVVDVWLLDLQNRIGVDSENIVSLERAAASFDPSKALQWAGQVATSLLSGGLAVVNLLSLIFITPVASFYLLRDWDKLVAQVDGWLPRRYAPVIREQVREINTILSGYARGQALLCLTLGTIYAIGLSLVGLQLGLIVGLLAGILAFIPYVGTFVGGVTSIGLALLQFDDPTRIALVVSVFLVGQMLEGYVLQPVLVGDRVRLHPVWMIFALLAGGVLAGFVGVLLAAPAAAVIGVLTRFGLSQYLASPLYHGHGPRAAAAAALSDPAPPSPSEPA